MIPQTPTGDTGVYEILEKAPGATGGDITVEKDTKVVECKCGSVEEISVSVDIEWNVCEKCKRRGQWQKQSL